VPHAPRRIHWLDRGFVDRPALDAAFSRAWLDRVASGAAPETFRLYRPDDFVAFSGMDATSAGFGDAVAAARAAGFDAALRLAGGRAAVFHRETLAFAWTIPAPDAREGIHARFETLASIVAAALRRLGVDARVGEVHREYCPGAHSVNARGTRKLAGVGQRVIRGAAHLGGVIVVDRSDRVREALVPVYAALGLDWEPATAGSVVDEIGRVRCEDVADALARELGERFELTRSEALPVDDALADAARLVERFEIGDGRHPPRSALLAARDKTAIESP
jgi:lipoate-protein ligase A